MVFFVDGNERRSKDVFGRVSRPNGNCLFTTFWFFVSCFMFLFCGIEFMLMGLVGCDGFFRRKLKLVNLMIGMQSRK